MPTQVIGTVTGPSYESKTTQSGVRPYTSPYPYTRLKSVVVSGYNSSYCRAGDGWPSVPLPDYLTTRLYGKYWGAIKGGSEAMLGVTIAESREVWEMMTGRLSQMSKILGLAQVDEWDFARLRRRKIASAPKRLSRASRRRLNVKPFDWRNSSKTAGSWWLEFWLGWSALINDLYEGYRFLASFEGLKPIDVRTRGSWTQVRGLYPQGTIPNGVRGQLRITHVNESFLRFGADIRVSDPDAHLLLALGLSNPAEVAVELVSRSFVLNWFVTLNEFMGQFNSRFGYTISNGYYTVFTKTETTCLYRATVSSPLTEGKISRFVINRVLATEPPGPSLALRPFKGFSTTRGATASSLLVQYLRSAPK